VCIGVNVLTHIASIIYVIRCVRNFGKGLKEDVFNHELDKWFQERWSQT